MSQARVSIREFSIFAALAVAMPLSVSALAVTNQSNLTEAVSDYDKNAKLNSTQFEGNQFSQKTVSATRMLNTPTSQKSLKLNPEEVPLNAISPNTIGTFVEAIDVVRQDYVKPVNDERLFQHAISGMLENLDKHAEYLTPKRLDNLRSFTEGEIGRVGLSARFSESLDAWVVDKVLPNSSAKESDIKVGEKLLRIKKVELTSAMTPEDIKQLLSGIAGSQVKVTVANKQGVQRAVTLQRNLSQQNTLGVSIQGNIAIVRLPVFQNSSKEQLVDALKQSGISITGVVLDVRNNPGGVLSSAIDIASLFVPEGGALIQVRNRTQSNQVIHANGSPYLSGIPVIVLQNRYSASAAEVLAISLQSNKAAKVVGERSFGKGTVQEVVALQSGGGIKLTVAEYLSAKGRPINGLGVQPDIPLSLNETDTWQRQAITLLLEQDRPLGVKFADEQGDVSIINDY